MTRDHLRRVTAIEQGRGVIPADIRAWLGEPVTAAELARCEVRPSLSTLPPDMQRWLDERLAIGGRN